MPEFIIKSGDSSKYSSNRDGEPSLRVKSLDLRITWFNLPDKAVVFFIGLVGGENETSILRGKIAPGRCHCRS